MTQPKLDSRVPVRSESGSFPPAASADAGVLSTPIVAIGASAGGLEALRAVLAKLPTNSGMAFVVPPIAVGDRSGGERAHMAGGTLRVEARPCHGSRVRLAVPPPRENT